MVEKRQFPHHLIREISNSRTACGGRLSRASLWNRVWCALKKYRYPAKNCMPFAASTSSLPGPADMPALRVIMAQELAGVHVDVDYASEFETRNPTIGPCELSIFITQSARPPIATALYARPSREALAPSPSRTLWDRPLLAEADGVIYTHAGPKSASLPPKPSQRRSHALHVCVAPGTGERKSLRRQSPGATSANCWRCPGRLRRFWLPLTNANNSPSAITGSKTSCFSPRHSLSDRHGRRAQTEGDLVYSRGRISHRRAKHGPNALIDYRCRWGDDWRPGDPDDRDRSGATKKCQQHGGFKKQGGTVIALATEGDTKILQLANHTFLFQKAPELLVSDLRSSRLQLFGILHCRQAWVGCGSPRDLVKSVTLE